MNVRFDRRKPGPGRQGAAAPGPAAPDGQATWIRNSCPYLFLVLCLASSLFLAWHLPPFQGADELAHAYRADLTTFGQLVAERVKKKNVVAGGATDQSLYEATAPFDSIRFNIQEKADVIDYTIADTARWDGRTTRTGYPGSAIYPPFFYLPQGAGLALGKLLNLHVVQSLYVARAANVLVCTLLGFAALMIAGRARLLLFTVLLLPMSVGVYATLSNDGLMIATTALGIALISRGMHEGRPLRRNEVIAAVACFALVGATKLPYAFIGLIFLACDTEKRRWRYIAAAATIGLALAWTIWMALAVQTALTAPGSDIDPERQVQWLLGHPLSVWPIAVLTLKNNFSPYAHMFIGVLGWLDTGLPEAYHKLAWTVLALAAAVSLSRGRGPGWRGVSVLTALTLLILFACIHAALYVTWNVVGADYVQGVQGRYFLPLAVVACLLVEGERPLLPRNRVSDWAYKAMAAVVLAFPLLSLLVVEHAIIVRYYLD